MNRLTRRQLKGTHEPTLRSNISSLYEPMLGQGYEEIPSALFSPQQLERFELGPGSYFNPPEDSFEESLVLSPARKGKYRSSVALRGLRLEPEQWKTMEISRPITPQTPVRPSNSNTRQSIQEESLEQQAINYIEALELNNFELENKIKSLEAKKN